ncbi:saccharopine dehydrogenase family protein [Solimonas marina]|uniref:Saccharopine dehydrogenase n=1 Tax=Solimonas marina TaxID=2714601 RepID=A0A969WDG1_9GAMM|nr:saccharopine dehydrogenase NADP-binding domain-containing protein [Solimonas marina]NKF22770.1 saccharopine dehydrogenase [Solimonas marina]
MARSRKYDLILFGATGFTGQLTAEYLARHGGAKLKWALAGRSPDKLKAVRARLADQIPEAAALDLLHADVDDAESLASLARSTRVVITTVGPYVVHGEPLVAACAAAGTDYVDLTGEPEFVDAMWLRYHDQARESGARIVHCCGFDSIPHDLGCWFTVQQLPVDVPLRVRGFVRAGGTFSGGTLHSAVLAMSRMSESAKLRRERRQREGWPVDRSIGSMHQGFRYVSELDSWALPMPTVDPQIVRRSAAALDRYGPDFRYGHYVQFKKLRSAMQLVAGVAAVAAAAQFKTTRERLLRVRGSGDGPSAEQRAKSWFKVTFLGEGGGRAVRCEVTGGDPGYTETAKMLAESALCLAFDKLPHAAGCITPVQAMGDALITRLQARGIRFRVMETVR